MAGFLAPLSVEPCGDGKYWKTNRALVYCVGSSDSAVQVRVPINFKTDFASVPRPLWSLFPPTDQYTPAAVVHDSLYQDPYLYLSGTRYRIDKATADKIFLEAMTVLNVPAWKRNTIYFAVKFGGSKAWNDHRREEQIAA
jgi:hypothetical protein